jgi:DNA-binding NtrC family response regulator
LCGQSHSLLFGLDSLRKATCLGVVDDDQTIRQTIISMLASADLECREAASGVEALAVLESGEEFEVMLADLMMPDLDGIGLLERSKSKYPDMPVVIVTSMSDISVALATIRNGGHDYLVKPFEREQLLALPGRRSPRCAAPCCVPTRLASCTSLSARIPCCR